MPDWPHAPPHRLFEPGAFFVTGATYGKRLHFRTRDRLEFLHELLLNCLREYGWRVQAWTVLANHYHFVAISPQDAGSLRRLLSKLHTLSSRHVNRLDGVPGRKVWHQFRETALTYRTSYFARLNYTHRNPVHHGLVTLATEYPWCSAGWFEQTADTAFRETVGSFRTDRVNVEDDFSDTLNGWHW